MADKPSKGDVIAFRLHAHNLTERRPLVEPDRGGADAGRLRRQVVDPGRGRRRAAVGAEGRGVRLLPPRDPYTQMRDRETIIDKKFHKDMYKKAGEPGAVLTHGKVAGIWRPRKNGRRLTITIKTFGSLATRDKKPLENEAEQVAPLRGATSLDIKFETY